MPYTSRSSILAGRIAVAVAITLNVIYLATSLKYNAVRFDSGYNLTVARNLAHGLGYASDGLIIRSGDVAGYADAVRLAPFDPAITTGPTVLAPLALGFLGGGDGLWLARGLMCVWYVALLVGLALLGRRLGGRWGMTAGLLSPLVLDPTMGIATEGLQGPTDVLGEVPVAALVVFATWCVTKRPHVAALLVGVAVLTKLIAFLAAPAIVVAGMLAVHQCTAQRVVRRFVSMSALVWAPLLCWQGVIWFSLGTSGYQANAVDQIGMFRSGGSGLEGEPRALTHARLLLNAWGLPLPVLLGAVVAVLVILGGGAVRARAQLQASWRNLSRTHDVLTAITAVGIVVPWLAWFVLLASRGYPRYAYPPLVLGAAAVLALVARALGAARGRPGAREVVAVACGATLLAGVGWQVAVTLHTTRQPASTTLPEQRAAAQALHDASPDDTFAYAGNAALPAALAFVADMTPIPASVASDRPLFVYGADAAEIEAHCRLPLLHQSPLIVVCRPAP